MLKNQIAVIQADMPSTCQSDGLALIGQIAFKPGQADIADHHIGLVVGIVAGAQLHEGAGVGLKREAVVGAGVPLSDEVGDIIAVPGVGGVHVCVVQAESIQRGRIVVGDGGGVPRAEHLFQVDRCGAGRR
ncbi:hypothetical protein SDC9_138362 [bioreactor metagenome]|uniref:Uncharacterized protein n=1 Tax=bioreactor metagenome TaxID=1076179 RepID=A0A645DPP7_9ZZZZ